jgi:hypothetical protein
MPSDRIPRSTRPAVKDDDATTFMLYALEQEPLEVGEDAAVYRARLLAPREVVDAEVGAQPLVVEQARQPPRAGTLSTSR